MGLLDIFRTDAVFSDIINEINNLEKRSATNIVVELAITHKCELKNEQEQHAYRVSHIIRYFPKDSDNAKEIEFKTKSHIYSRESCNTIYQDVIGHAKEIKSSLMELKTNGKAIKNITQADVIYNGKKLNDASISELITRFDCNAYSALEGIIYTH
ncbi:MAG: hypothetical protein KAT91_01580 [Candidatus Aenigmarchaeota archaeon]|nr:hypothetical protein [Candidatus Aenigmarchaeota archaeon]